MGLCCHKDPLAEVVDIDVNHATSEIISEVYIRRVELLKGVKLFETLGDKDIADLAPCLEVRHFNATDRIVTQGEEGFDCFIVDAGKAYAQIKTGDHFTEVKQYEAGGFFGERALLRSEPRAADVIARTELRAFSLSREHFVAMIENRNKKEHLIKSTHLFENMTDEQVARLAGLLERREFEKGHSIIMQGEPGQHLYILEEGMCQASIETAAGSQVVKEYEEGEVFGEKALLENALRSATITAMTHVVAFMLSREDFEKKLGPLTQLHAEQYLADPRKLVADFYQQGDHRGPAGTLLANGLEPDYSRASKWFAVYRPCSRDAIAKMLGRSGVGKGLNVKGKSAKRNRLSGFVPFVQISDNEHKKDVEMSPKDARTSIYYKNAASRDAAFTALNNVLKQVQLKMDDPEIRLLDNYHDTPGLDIPEPLMREVYIMRHDVSPMVGWETGRASEPAFMDMNLHAVRGNSDPKVVLFQFDASDPMNPLGLLVAYAEKTIKPVVSDFDTFTIGSKGMTYAHLPDKQRELIDWELENAQKVIENGGKSWTASWLDVLKREADKGFHPTIPKYGFGDPTSVNHIGDVVNMTAPCGAVRHGAECFNFYFPQELDDEFLVVWDGYQDPPWRQLKEDELRIFLSERAKEDYIFPINPVWPMRDPGWHDILKVLRSKKQGQEALKSWFTDKHLEKIDEVCKSFPDGFQAKKNALKRASTMAGAQDLTGEEMADFVRNEVRKVVRARWARVRASLIWATQIGSLRK